MHWRIIIKGPRGDMFLESISGCHHIPVLLAAPNGSDCRAFPQSGHQ